MQSQLLTTIHTYIDIYEIADHRNITNSVVDIYISVDIKSIQMVLTFISLPYKTKPADLYLQQ